MRLSDRELLLVFATCILTLLLGQDASLRIHRLVAAAAERSGAHELAERHRHAAIARAEIGTPLRRRAEDHEALARLHRSAGRLAESDRELRRGLVLLGEDARAHAALRRRIRSELIDVSLSAGRSERARQEARALLRGVEEVDGPDHPLVAKALETLAAVETEAGRPHEAEQARRRALAIHEATLGAGHPEVGRALTALGALLRASGRAGPAVGVLERGLAVLERVPDPRTPAWRRALAALGLVEPSAGHLLPALNELALAYRDEGRSGEAERVLRRALKEAAAPELATERSVVLVNLAELLRRRGSFEKAEARALEALAVAERANVSPALTAAMHRVAAGVLTARGRRVEAREHAEHAARLARLEPPEGHASVSVRYASLPTASGSGPRFVSNAGQRLALSRRSFSKTSAGSGAEKR